MVYTPYDLWWWIQDTTITDSTIKEIFLKISFHNIVEATDILVTYRPKVWEELTAEYLSDT